jgi:hypothetical protein
MLRMENWTVRTLIVTGPFTDGEFAEVVDLMRNIDARHPDAVFGIVMDDPPRTLSDAEQALIMSLPPKPGRVTTVPSRGGWSRPHSSGRRKDN